MKETFGHGIDVSQHNGVIRRNETAKAIDFAIIRAGFGKNNIDRTAVYNVLECQRNKIPFGLYWFSYAFNTKMALDESNFLCDFADKYAPALPLFFDFEYDSDLYAEKNGYKLSGSQRKEIAQAFLNNVEKRGYFACLYTNIDYLNKGFRPLTDRFAVWLAQWGIAAPSISCAFWQNSDNGRIAGIDGNVDTNVAYKNFTALNNINKRDQQKEEIIKKQWERYYKLGLEIIKGKYGNGETRKKKLNEEGYDYTFAQAVVNWLVM